MDLCRIGYSLLALYPAGEQNPSRGRSRWSIQPTWWRENEPWWRSSPVPIYSIVSWGHWYSTNADYRLITKHSPQTLFPVSLPAHIGSSGGAVAREWGWRGEGPNTSTRRVGDPPPQKRYQETIWQIRGWATQSDQPLLKWDLPLVATSTLVLFIIKIK